MPSAIKVAVLVCSASDGAAGRDGWTALGRWGGPTLAALEFSTVVNSEAKKEGAGAGRGGRMLTGAGPPTTAAAEAGPPLRVLQDPQDHPARTAAAQDLPAAGHGRPANGPQIHSIPPRGSRLHSRSPPPEGAGPGPRGSPPPSIPSRVSDSHRRGAASPSRSRSRSIASLMRASEARRRTHERSSRSRSLSLRTELREARRAARLADEVA